ncbi:hypothetical protein PMAYCL1PPCAC_13711, partial [Pristionchus mayeri]
FPLKRKNFSGERGYLFGVYRMMLFMFASVDIYYAIVHFLVMPILESWDNAVCMAGHGYFSGKIGVSYFGGV